jgi:hypothetical protein
LRRKSALGGEQGGVGGVKGRFDAGIFGVVGWEKIKPSGVRAGGFGRRVLHGKKKKYGGVEQGGAENGEREKKVNPVPGGPLEDECGSFHFSSEVATTVG